MSADYKYQQLIKTIMEVDHSHKTRNEVTKRKLFLDVRFTEVPIVTVRKTAVTMALRELEWMMTGESKVPEFLLKWWGDQIAPDGHLYRGYGEQFRKALSVDMEGQPQEFDQIGLILDSLIKHPNSRRMVMTTWNPWDMANITNINKNSKTPTNCFHTMTQFFVEDKKLYCQSHQRSADMLLGVPHDWVETWALMMYLAHHSGLGLGELHYTFGDAHIYQTADHIQAANEFLALDIKNEAQPFTLKYEYSGGIDSFGLPQFKASDFKIEGIIPEPKINIKMKIH